jgi:hypothetical protein
LGNAGAAFVFRGSASGIVGTDPASAATRLTGAQAFTAFGLDVDGAGDVDGDGYDDAIAQALGSPLGDRPGFYLFHGSPSGIPDATTATAATRLQLGEAGGTLGASRAGDVNGDGYDDVLVSLWLDASGRKIAAVFHGSASGIPDGTPATADARIEYSWQFDSVAGAGDVDGDGYDDILVVSPEVSLFQAVNAQNGLAGLFLGSATGVADASYASAAAFLVSDQPDALFGTSLAGSGDVDGDGFDDVIVGAPGLPGDQSEEGAAFVLLGPPEPDCSNGVDDDGDGAADYPDDPGCTSAADPVEKEPGLACDDVLDQELDGIDILDPGCRDASWPLEDPKCDNDLDGDGDGRVDADGEPPGIGLPDLDCVGRPWRNREGWGCGLGAELAPLLAALAACARRIRRRSA